MLGPARALVLLPIQFVFDSPQINAAAKSSFEQFYAVHRYTASFAENDFAKDRSFGPPPPTRTKKADVAEHPMVFDHVGLLTNEPPSTAGLLLI
jgi:hypothetical protein